MTPVQKSKAGHNLGIAGIIFGVAAILTLFAYNGTLSVLMGIVGIILVSVGLGQARDHNGETGIIYTGLTVAIIATSLALLWFFMVVPDKDRIEFKRQVQHKSESYDFYIHSDDIEDISTDIEGAIEDIDEVLEDVLIDLESEIEDGKQRIEIHINDSDIQVLKERTGNTIKKAINELLKEIPDSIHISVETDIE